MKDLHRDPKGVLYNTDENISQLNILELLKERPDIYGYGGSIDVLKSVLLSCGESIVGVVTAIRELIIALISLTMNLILLPVYPIVRPLAEIYVAKKRIKRRKEFRLNNSI